MNVGSILAYEAAFERISSALPPDMEVANWLRVQQNGSVRSGSETLDPAQISPTVIWISLDAFEAGVAGVFLDAALTAPTLRWVQTFNAGMDTPTHRQLSERGVRLASHAAQAGAAKSIDAPFFRQVWERGVRVSKSSAQAVAIAEYCLAQILTEWHPIARQRAAQHMRKWQRMQFKELSMTRWLIVGYGNIGREIGRRAQAFGAEVVGVRRSRESAPFANHVVTPEDLPQLVSTSDIVILACGLNEATRGIAGSSFFGLMKPDSLFVNIGRGALVHEAALIDALNRGAPRVAILDAFQEEPLSAENPLWAHPNVRVTAHTSGAGSGVLLRGDRLFVGNLIRYAAGDPLMNEVQADSFQGASGSINVQR